MPRRGFTLIEMLVATGIFMFAFSAIYAMFLVGMRQRAQSEAITRSALASSSIIAEMRLRAGLETTPAAPEQYIGDGNAEDGGEFTPPTLPNTAPEMSDSDEFFAYHDQPGLFYRVVECTDLVGNTGNTAADAIRIRLLIGQIEAPGDTISIATLKTRIRSDNNPDAAAYLDELVQRAVLQEYDAIIRRQHYW